MKSDPKWEEDVGTNVYTVRLDNPQIDALDVCSYALSVDRSAVIRACILSGVKSLVKGDELSYEHKGQMQTLQMSPTSLKGRRVSSLRQSYHPVDMSDD